VEKEILAKACIQAIERKHPGRSPAAGRLRRREFEYSRHGTQALIAALDVRAQPDGTPLQMDFPGLPVANWRILNRSAHACLTRETSCKQIAAEFTQGCHNGRLLIVQAHNGRWEPLPGSGSLDEMAQVVVTLLQPYLQPDNY
jgi:hypothetical protein